MTPEELKDQGFHEACKLSQIPQIMPFKATINGRSLLLCRTAEGVSAVDEMCPHKMQSMAFGVVHEDSIICPHHQYKFDLQTGKSSMRRCPPVNVYDTYLVEDTVYVKA